MNTSEIGERSEGAVLAALLKTGYYVLTPFGASRRYDLVVEDEAGAFHRVQVKHGRVDNDAVVFRTFSSRGKGPDIVRKSYHGEVEFFGVYASELDKVYLVPMDQIATKGGDCRLRLRPTKNNQVAGIRWAEDYEI